MKSDVTVIASEGKGIEEALIQAEKVAVYNELDEKQQLKLRLLTEEMTGMLRAIVGDMTATFWIEAENNHFELHLSTLTIMDSMKRDALLKTSSSGKNEAAKGFMGKLWDVLMKISEPEDSREPGALDYGYVHTDIGSFDAPMGIEMYSTIGSWSLQNYKNKIQENIAESKEAWDELEKSVTAKLADEIRVRINGNMVEMILYKAF